MSCEQINNDEDADELQLSCEHEKKTKQFTEERKQEEEEEQKLRREQS